jgi:NitT/TauT family transport system permease protein
VSDLPERPTQLTVAAKPAVDSTGGVAQSARALARVIIPPILVLAGVIGVWYFMTYRGLSESQRFILPPPHEVFSDGLLTWKPLKEILEGLWATTVVVLVGLMISIVVGMSIAILMSRARWIERTMFPYAVALQTIPIIAITPIIGLWLGFAFNARVLVTVIISIFPVITNTLFGLQAADQNLHDIFSLHRSSSLTRLWKLELPAAQPAIFTGLRIAAGLAVTGAIVGEFFFRGGKEKGIGRLISFYQNRLQIDRLMSAIVLSSLLGVVLFLIVGAIGDRATRHWAPGERR